MRLDGIENMELFLTLKNEQVSDVPNVKLFGKKVNEDCQVSMKIDMIKYVFLNQSFYIQCIFRLCFGIRMK